MDPIVYMGCTTSRKFKSFKGLKKKTGTFPKSSCTFLSGSNCQYRLCPHTHVDQYVHFRTHSLSGLQTQTPTGARENAVRRGIKHQGVVEGIPNRTASQAPSKGAPWPQHERKAGVPTSSDLSEETRNLGLTQESPGNISGKFKYLIQNTVQVKKNTRSTPTSTHTPVTIAASIQPPYDQVLCTQHYHISSQGSPKSLQRKMSMLELNKLRQGGTWAVTGNQMPCRESQIQMGIRAAEREEMGGLVPWCQNANLLNFPPHISPPET